MFTAPNNNQSPQDVFLTRFHLLSQLLIEDNYTNMRNLNMANHNFNEIFSYLKGIIRHMCNRCNRLEERNKDLQEELVRIDPKNIVLNRKERDEDKWLGEAGIKFNQFTPLQARRTNSFASRFIVPTVQVKTPRLLKNRKVDNPEDIRQEFKNIEKFIAKHLSKYLVPNKEYQIEKDILVNLYRKWIEKKGKSVLVKKKMLIKMQITNELKKIFLGLSHNDRYYNGIGFREDLVLNLEVKTEENTQIPPNTEESQQNTNRKWLNIENNSENDNKQFQIDQYQFQMEELDHLAFEEIDLQNDYDLCQGFEDI